MAYDVGTAFLQIVPSFRNIRENLDAGVRQIAKEIEKTVGDALPDGVAKGAKGAEREARVAGRRSGAAFGGSLGRELQTAMKAAQENLPELSTRIDPTQLDRDLDRIRQEIGALGQAHINMEIDDSFVIASLKRLRQQLREIQVQARDDISIGVNSKDAADILDTLDELERTGRRRGFDAGGTFSDAFTKRVVAAFRGLPQLELEPDIDLEHPLAQIRDLRNRLQQLQHQRVGIDFDANEALDAMKDMEAQFRRIAETATSPQLRKDADRARAELAQFFTDIKTESQRFADEQFNAMVKQAMAEARKQEALRAAAQAKAEAAERKAAEDLVAWRQRLVQNSVQAEFRERVKANEAAARQAVAEAEKAARDSEAAFARTFAGRIPQMMREAAKAFPERFTIDADASPAEREIFELTSRMRALGEYDIGVEIDADDAYEELATLRRQLQQLARTAPDIEVRTNATAALSQINAVEGGARQSQRELLGLAERANFAQSRLTLMINAGAMIAPIIAPAAATAAAAIGFIGTAAGAAMAGIGVFALGLSGISDAVGALDAAQKDAEKSAKSVGAAQNQLISAADGVRSAVQGVANARASADEAAVNAAERVANAERGVISARREAGEAATRSAERVADAERAVLRVRRDAGEAAKAAAESLEEAQRDLTRAEDDALDVRKDLNEAIRDAKRDMEDLNQSIKENALDQREATTAIMEEREKLNRILANPRATEIEKRNAQESFDARVLQLKKLQTEGKRMAEDQAKYAKQGVEANDKVIAARDRIRQADERVANQQRAVAKAQQRVAEVQMESVERVAAAERDVSAARRAQVSQQIASAERVAAAERDVSAARRAQVAQQRQSATAVANAQQALASAQRAQAQAILAQATAGGEAMDKLKEAMEALSPAGQRFAKFIFGLKDELKSMRDAAQEGLLPGLQEGIQKLLPYLPGLNAFIREMGQALGELFVRLVDSLGNPTWQRFFGFFRTSAIPTLQLMFESGMNVAEGFAELFLALTPFNGDIGQGLLDLTEGFAKWARELNTTTGYQEFLAYVRDVGPEVVNLLLQMGEFAGRLVVAMAPVGAVLVDVFGGLFEFLNAIPPGLLTAIAIGITLIGTAILGMGLAGKAYSGLRSLFTNLSLARTHVMDAFTRSTDLARTSVEKLGRTQVGGNLTRGFDSAASSAGNFGRQMGLARTPTQLMEADMARMNRTLGSDDPAGKKGLIGGMGRAGGAMALLTAAGVGLSAVLSSSTERNMHAFTQQLVEFGRTGQATGDLADEFGTDLNELQKHMQWFQEGGVKDFERGVEEFGAGLLGLVGIPAESLDASLASAQARMKEIDGVMAQLVSSGRGEDAAALFNRLATMAKEQGVSIEALNKQLPQYNNQLGVSADAAKAAADKANTLTVEMTEQVAVTTRSTALQQALTNATNLSTSARAQLGTSYDQNAAKINALSTLVDQFNTVEGTAAGRAKALKDVIDLQTGSFVRANEAEETFKSSMAQFTETVKANAKSLEGHRNKLDINTAAGRTNRDALQQVASRVRDLYLADIESGVPMDQATKRHQARIRELKEEARRAGLNRDETRKLIDAYGDVPQDVITQFSTGNSFNKVYTELRRLNFMQKLIELGITDPKEAATVWQQSEHARLIAMANPRATGGPIAGKGTKTSDSILIRASDGEFMQQASSVDYYGIGFMDAINRRMIPREVLPGFATGGFVQTRRVAQPRYTSQTKRTRQRKSAKAPYDVNVEDAFIPSEKDARAVIEARMVPMGGTAVGDINVARIAESTARKMKASNKQLVALIEAGIVESGMRNLSYGDRDSIGFLQQRPSQGWGTRKQIMDPAYATRRFIAAAKRKDRKNQTPGQLAQAVQVSAFPDRYDAREADAYAVLNKEYPYVSGGGSLGGAKGGQGYQWQLNVLRKAFPGIDVYSTFRKGSRTLSGNLSWHARGRAVDVEPTRRIAQWIKNTYGRNTLELITPWRDMMLYKGKPHRYSAAVERQHGVGSAGNDHIHWAYDEGGWLPPGMTSVINNTGRPEAVFTAEQFRDIRALVEGRTGAGSLGQQVYNFEFANTTLDAARLQAIQQRQDALNRVGRRNY